MAYTLYNIPAPVVHEGINGTGIREGEKIMADYSFWLDGVESRRTAILRVNSAWPMGNGRTYVSGMDADGRGPAYVVHSDSIRIIA